VPLANNPNWPDLRAYVDFTNPGASPSTTWTDITGYCHRLGDGLLAHIERGRNYERAQTDSGILNLTLDNSKGAFDPENTSSPFYPNVKSTRKIKIEATWLGVTYGLFHGRVEEWPRIWKAAGYWGEVGLTARGIFASLSSVTLQAAWVNAAVLDGAQAIYRLNDPSGSVSAANSSPFQQNYGLIKFTAPTTNASSFTFGSTPGTGNLAGDPTNALDLVPQPIANAAAGYYLEVANAAAGNSELFFPTATAWSFEIWFRIPTTVIPYVGYLMSQSSGNVTSGTAQATIYIDAITHQLIAVFQDGGAGGQVMTVGGIPFDQDWHQVVVTFDPALAGGTLTLYFDGVQPVSGGVAAPTGTIVYIAPPKGQALGTLLDTPSSIGGFGCFPGSLKNAAWYTSALTAAQALQHFHAGQGFVGDDTGARIARILNYAPYALQSLDVGNSILGRMNIENVNVVQAIQDANNTEVGTLIEKVDGYIGFKNRQSRNPTNVDATTMGDQPGQTAYQDDLVMQQDPAYIFTDIVVARDTGITVTTVDTSAELDFFPRTLSLNSKDNTDAQAIYLSQYLLGQYKVGRTRIPVLTIVPSSHPAYFPLALSIDIGTKVGVVRTNTTPGAQPISGDFYVEKITHDIQVGVWKVTYMLSSSTLWDETFILDDSTYGVLDTSRLGF
jgi:hypothetical protein